MAKVPTPQPFGYVQDDLWDPNKMLTEILGDDNTKPLTADALRANYGDLLSAVGFTKEGVVVGVELTDEDLASIAAAIQQKTGWTYNETTVTACCCCWPNI